MIKDGEIKKQTPCCVCGAVSENSRIHGRKVYCPMCYHSSHEKSSASEEVKDSFFDDAPHTLKDHHGVS